MYQNTRNFNPVDNQNRTMVWFLTVRKLFNPEDDRSAVFSLSHVYLTSRDFNWRQLGENTADQSSSGLNSFRTVKNQTMVLFWLLIGMKFRVD